MKRWLSSLVGLVIGGLFLYLTMRRVDLRAFAGVMGRLGFWEHGAMALLCLATLVFRGWRWWFLLPEPRRRGEWWLAQRALSIGYLVTYVASRLGEVARIGFFAKDSKRGIGEVTGTVVLDRILLDFVFFALALAVSLNLFKAELAAILPAAEPFLRLFLAGTLGVLLVLAALALRPVWFLNLLRAMRVNRMPWIGERILALTAQLAEGLGTLQSPVKIAQAWFLNLFSWGLPILFMGMAFESLGIECSLSHLLLMFTLGTVGIVIPSPGGLGTYHYMVSQGLIQVLAVEPNLAAAAAVYIHGLNFLVTALAGAVGYFWKPGELSPLEGRAGGSFPRS